MYIGSGSQDTFVPVTDSEEDIGVRSGAGETQRVLRPSVECGLSDF